MSPRLFACLLFSTFAIDAMASLPSQARLSREIEQDIALQEQTSAQDLDAATNDAQEAWKVASLFDFFTKSLDEPNPANRTRKSTTPSSSGRCRNLTGVASWYGPELHGRTTASGERFNMGALTAAHRTLPFGAHVRVTNLNNGRHVIVKINDRGPFVAGRIIDLSKAAANSIGMGGAGTSRVSLEACL